MKVAEKSDNVRAVGRALEILQAFTPQDSELSAGELLKRVDLSRPTLYRLLYTLQEHGFLLSVGEPQRFRLGPSVAQLAHAWSSSLDLATLAEPVLRRLWQATRETVAIFVPQGNLRMCVAELPSPQPLNFKRGVGYTEKLALGASGRAILAFADEGQYNLRALVHGTGIDSRTFEQDLAQTRRRGFATSRSELISGAVAVAVPFFDRNALVAGSIGVFGPEVRLDNARLKEVSDLLMAEAVKLSQALGYGSAARPRA